MKSPCRKSQRTLPGVYALFLLLPLLGLAAGCGKQEEPPAPPVVRPVKVVTVVSGGVQKAHEYPGTTRAHRRVDLSFKVPGPLVELPAEEGQEMRKGDLIARILPRDFKIRLDEAQARAREAEQQFNRYQQLFVRKQVSKAEFDRYKASRDVARAQLEDAQNALKDTYLKAPFEGVVGKRHVDNFEEVQAKQPIVFYQDVSQIEILVDVPESIVARLRGGDKLQATARFSIAPDSRFPLELKEFATKADPQTQTYQVVLLMDQPEGINVLPGMTATVEGVGRAGESTDSTIVVPAVAVLEDAGGKAHVWVLEESGMTVKKTAVRVGEITGSENIQVLEGLQGGEKIAVSGVTKLKDGMKVRIWK